MTLLKPSLAALALLAPALLLVSSDRAYAAIAQPSSDVEEKEATKEASMLVQYLEIVTSDVDATCGVLSKAHGVTFGEPDARLGNARTAPLHGGGMIGVRAPMAEHDMLIVRPYVLAEDIGASIKVAEEIGSEIGMPPSEIPGHGKFAIYFSAGTQLGLWETRPSKDASASDGAEEATKVPSILVQYLEIVSSDVDATRSGLAKVHGVTFGEPVAMLGNARTAALSGGGRISVRAPMAEHDQPIVRPYMLVDDIEAAIKSAEAAGAEFAMRTTEIPGQGKFAIYLVAGTQFGLWENQSSEEASG